MQGLDPLVIYGVHLQEPERAGSPPQGTRFHCGDRGELDPFLGRLDTLAVRLILLQGPDPVEGDGFGCGYGMYLQEPEEGWFPLQGGLDPFAGA